MLESGTSGSVGAAGEQSPVATRPVVPNGNLSNRFKNIRLNGQVLSLHTFPVYASFVINLLTGLQKAGVKDIRI